tara:strand:+ start:499 stop:837 length:339 start_codon:yes stop_codon:yes gene_type:complete
VLTAENNTIELETSTLKEKVEPNSQAKEWLVNYAGRRYKTELNKLKIETGEEIEWNGDVTVEMIVGVMAEEFPEFVMALAEENFIRGYRQAFTDMETGFELAKEQAQDNEPS